MGFFGRLFGKKNVVKSDANFVNEIVETILKLTELDLSFETTTEQVDTRTIYKVDLFGDDEGLLLCRDANLMNSIQFFVKRVMQNKFKDKEFTVLFDSNNYRERAQENLLNLVKQLRDQSIERGKTVYLKQLPPRERKIVHQFLSEDDRIKSRSIGEGIYKKIKIFPAKKSASPA